MRVSDDDLRRNYPWLSRMYLIAPGYVFSFSESAQVMEMLDDSPGRVQSALVRYLRQDGREFSSHEEALEALFPGGLRAAKGE